MDIYLGETARHLRESLGLTQRAAAAALGISHVHLCNIEKNRAVPSQTVIDKFRELWGVDLYVLAWCTLADSSKLPKPLQKAAADLEQGWKEHVNSLIEKHRKAAGS